jgi:DNA-binding protein HU-beta
MAGYLAKEHLMNRPELIDLISEKADITKAAASRALDALLEGVTYSLQQGDPVVLVNFGTFTVKMRAAREGRNPSTGEKIKIKAAKVVGFKAGKALKEAVKDQEKVNA